MSLPKIVDAMQYLDDDLISGAEEYQPKKKRYTWLRWGAVAACLVLVVTLVLGFMDGLPGTVPGTVPSKLHSTATVIYGDEGVEYSSSKDLLVGYTEAEMFAMENRYIFRGTVLELTNITIDFNGRKEYRCIALMQVDKVYKGDMEVGSQIEMILPCPILTDYRMEDTGVISHLREGMEGIFMPIHYEEDSYWEANGKTLYHTEVAPYGLGDGMRWAFFEAEQGLIFARFAYPGAAGAKSLDDIEAYVYRMLK